METDLPPEELFALLANQTRLEILRVLWAATEREDGQPGPSTGPQFSEVFAAVGIDDTGNFSYHLDKLEGHLVEATEEGYVLTQAGRDLLDPVLEPGDGASGNGHGEGPKPASGTTP